MNDYLIYLINYWANNGRYFSLKENNHILSSFCYAGSALFISEFYKLNNNHIMAKKFYTTYLRLTGFSYALNKDYMTAKDFFRNTYLLSNENDDLMLFAEAYFINKRQQANQYKKLISPKVIFNPPTNLYPIRESVELS